VNQIQYSTKLGQTNLGQTNWIVLTNLVVTASPYWFVDVAAPPAPFRFYRVIALEPINNLAPTNLALIPAGSFTMGDNLDGESDALPLHTVYVSAFYMDKYDVTKTLWDSVYQWATNHGYRFDYAGSGKALNHPVQTIDWYDMVKWCNARSQKEGLNPCYYTSGAQTTLYQSGQVNLTNACVNWAATGYRLPTEAEWEKAARGGLSGQRFPWGDTISWSQANYYADPSGYTYDVNPTSGYHPTFNDGVAPYTSPVDYFTPNGYGLYDMAGNVWQWCWDWYDGSWYSNVGATQTDTHGPSGALSLRVLRGGEWDYGAGYSRCASRYGYYAVPSDAFVSFGFRCVRGL
jgi:formylglycine-generating enzyme